MCPNYPYKCPGLFSYVFSYVFYFCKISLIILIYIIYYPIRSPPPLHTLLSNSYHPRFLGLSLRFHCSIQWNKTNVKPEHNVDSAWNKSLKCKVKYWYLKSSLQKYLDKQKNFHRKCSYQIIFLQESFFQQEFCVCIKGLALFTVKNGLNNRNMRELNNH